MNIIEKNAVAWYVLRVTYQREIAASKYLDEIGVKNYVPTVRVRKTNEKGVTIGWKTDPLIHNYIFINDSYNNVLTIKQGKLDYLRFVMGKDDNGVNSVPQYVPDKQMEDFIRVVQARGSKPVDLDIDLRQGERVRVLTGPFEGLEGVFVGVDNRHEKRVVVRIEGIAAHASPALKSSEVEKI